MKTCKHCSGSGIYIGMPICNAPTYTGGPPAYQYNSMPCKYCNGKGYIDEDELFTVKRKYVKDEYFKEL